METSKNINTSNEEIFYTADTNNDQQLSQEEAQAIPEVDTEQEFKLSDENKDNLISFDEYVNALPEENTDNAETVMPQSNTPQIENTDDTETVVPQSNTPQIDKEEPNIDWKELAKAVAKSDKEWNNYVDKVDKLSEYLNKLSDNHIEKEEVEKILYRYYVQQDKDDKKGITQEHPIQITEKTDVREKVIEKAARHIITHGRTLPKELKKEIQELPAKFEPFKFEHKVKEEKSIDGKPLKFDKEEVLGIGSRNVADGNISNGSVMQSGFGGEGRVISGNINDRNISKVDSAGNNNSSKAGGMSLPEMPEPKFSLGKGFDGIGSFSKKKRPIKIKMPKKSKSKKVEFPDLSPYVEQHNEMENIPQVTKVARPIIKNGLYQNKEDKINNDIYSNVIKDIIEKYKEWEKDGDVYFLGIPKLNITLFYDGVSQPKISVPEFGGKNNISTLLRKEGGRQILESLYNYLEGGK